jgi:hypothetical protein
MRMMRARHSVKVVVAMRKGFILAVKGSASIRSIFILYPREAARQLPRRGLKGLTVEA